MGTFSADPDADRHGGHSQRATSLSQYSKCCSTVCTVGLVLSILALLAGFATVLTLYFTKPGPDAFCPTTTMTTSTTTTSTTSMHQTNVTETSTTTITTHTTINVTTTTSTSTTSTSTVTSTTSTTTTTTTATTTSTTTTTTTTMQAFDINLVYNGDAETGRCESNNGISSPPGWGVSGPITQAIYDSPYFAGQTASTPGPADRGNCQFVGQLSNDTGMWQRVNLTSGIDPDLIDSSGVYYNFSAYIGGAGAEDDCASVSLTFVDASENMIGDQITLGPVLASDRDNTTQLIIQKESGTVPANARALTIFVLMTRYIGTQNNAAVDNIVLILSR